MKYLIIFSLIFHLIFCDFCEKSNNFETRIFSSTGEDRETDLEFLRFYIKRLYQKNIKFCYDVLDFIERLEKNDQKINAIRILFDEIDAGEDFNRIEFMRYVKLINEYSKQYEDNENLLYIKSKISDHILNFPWNDVVKIRNKHFRLFLYGTNETWGRYNLDEKRSLVSVSVSTDLNKEFFWELHQQKNKTTFKIFSVNLNQYLCADTSRSDGFNRNVIIYKTEKPKECYDEWEIEPFEENKSFRIKNVFWDEYIYAIDSLSSGKWQRKLTYLWRTYGCDGDQCAWDFIPVK